MATSTGDALLAYLGQQLGELLRHGPGALAGQPEPIHQLRVAARRLRSLLATDEPCLPTAPLRTSAASSNGFPGCWAPPWIRLWSGTVCRALLAEEPPELVVGPAADRIDEALDASAAAGMASLIEALDGERYALLLGRLSEFVTAAPQTAKAARGPRGPSGNSWPRMKPG